MTPPRTTSVFWRLTAVLAAVQITIGIAAVLLSAYLGYDRSVNLAGSSVRLRLDAVAEEIEQRALWDPLNGPSFPTALAVDLPARFPDPLYLLAPDGSLRRTFLADASSTDQPQPEVLRRQDRIREILEAGQIRVETSERGGDASWGIAPFYDPDGLLAGGILVAPLRRSLARELGPTRAAYVRTTAVVAGLSALIAVILSALLTLALVRPLRRITRQVERIGAGEYGVRLHEKRKDELGRLSASINAMAVEVARSIETLREADAMRRELVANIGHDLRTPMAAMLAYLEEADRYMENGETEKARQTLEASDRQGRYLRHLISDLFELSLLDSPAPPLRREPVPLGEMLSDAAASHRSLFSSENIRFETDIPSGLPVVYADAVRLLRVLDNLLDNARRHTPDGGSVRLRAAVENDLLTVEVADSGSGLDPDQPERVFERYYRGNDARTMSREGTGLGLSISKATARAHGGDLVATGAPGRGAVFTLTLPLLNSEDVRQSVS